MSVSSVSVYPSNHTLSALRYPNFRLYTIGQLISMPGTWMQRIAQGWLIFELTDSELWLGLVAFASGLPTLLLSPFAGVLADRISRRSIWIVTQALEMLCALMLAFLTFQDTVQIWHIMAIAFIVGTTSAFGEPARLAFIRDLVGTKDLSSGIALSAIIANTSVVIGPSLAGILLLKIGAAWCFLLNGISFLAVIFVLFLIHTSETPHANEQDRPLQQLREGLNFSRHHKTIAPMLIIGAAINIFGTNMFLTLLPAFASIELHSPKVAYAALNAAFGFGGLMGSVINLWLGRRFGRGHIMTLMAVLMPSTIFIVSQITLLPLAVIITGLAGFCSTSFFVTTNVLIQMEVSDEFRGRVISLWALNRFGLAPIGALFIGMIADSIGTSEMMAIGGLIAFIICGYTLSKKEAMRQLT